MSNQNPDPNRGSEPLVTTDGLSVQGKSISSKQIAMLALMFAVIFVSMTLDRLISFFSVTTIAIISVSTCISLALFQNKWWVAPIAGLFFGLSSFITAFMFGKVPFYNPLISIVPRIFVGLFAFAAYRLMLLILSRIPHRRTAQIISSAFGAIIGVVTNTALVLFAMFKFSIFPELKTLGEVYAFFILTNFLPELIIATALVPPIVIGVRLGLNMDIGGKSAETE